MRIIGKFVYLKRISHSDSDYVYKLRKKKNISLYLHKPPKSVDDQAKWISNNLNNKKALDFIIFKRKNNKRIGTIGFDQINKLNAEWGRWICEGDAHENIESVIILLNYGFRKLKLKNIYSLTNIHNKKVVNFHKNTTAQYRGRIKSLFLIDNKKVDAIKFSFNKINFEIFKKKIDFMIQPIQL